MFITKLDHCNSVLVGTAGYLQNWLQSVLNAAVGLSTLSGRQNTEPHCSRTFTGDAYQSESSFGCVLAYHCLHGTAPAYLADSLQPTSLVVVIAATTTTTTTTKVLIIVTLNTKLQGPSPSTVCRNNDADGAADTAGNLWRPRVSGGCGASMAQSATTDKDRLVAVVFPAADNGPSVSPVIRLLNVPAVTVSLTDCTKHAAPFLFNFIFF